MRDELVPEIRFTEFERKWNTVRVESITSLVSGNHLKPEDYNKEGIGIPYLTGPSDIGAVTKYTNKSTKIVSNNSTLITVKGSSAGQSMHYEGEDAAIGRQLMAIIAAPDVDSQFVSILLYRKEWTMSQLALGNMIPGISRNDILKLKVNLPTLPEQQKIATFLSLVDRRLAAAQRRVALLEKWKRGVVQRVFKDIPPNLKKAVDTESFSIVRLGDISVISTGDSNREDSLDVGKYPFFDRSLDIRRSNKYLFEGNAIIIAGEGQSFPPKFYNGKYDLHQRAYSIRDFHSSVNPFYVFYILDKFKNYFKSQAVGSTVKSLRLPMFKKMPIPLPSLNEQNRIASALTTIDARITSAQKEVTGWETWKKGLLQKMLV